MLVGKTALNETTTCIGSHLAKKSGTEEICWRKHLHVWLPCESDCTEGHQKSNGVHLQHAVMTFTLDTRHNLSSVSR